MCVLPVLTSYEQDELGFTALGTASQEGYVDVAQLLIERGAAIDYQNKVRAVVTV